jgi:hypothetical protein
MRRALVGAVLAVLLAWPCAGIDLKVPRDSPKSIVGMTVGVTDVTLAFHRPAVKGRTIWGGLVPYGEVWRLGANNATTLTVSDPVKVAGHDIPAGSYGLFALPGKDRWTLILSKRPVQWGAFFYRPEEDLLRFEVTPEPGPMTEWLTFTILPAGFGKAAVTFQWEKLQFTFPIEVDVDKVVWSQYDAALAETQGQDWGVLLTAANYALQREQRLDEAHGWIDRSIALQESFWNYETKARLLKREGRTGEALVLLDRAIELSRGTAPKNYLDGLEKTRQEWTAPPPATPTSSGGSPPRSH